MAKRRLTSRQKRQRTKKIRNRVILALAVLALTSAAMAPELRAYLNAKIRRGVQAFADLRAQEIEVTLPERRIYALQLGVFDNGESAESERKRLAAMGVPCVVWQDAQMRLMADAATSRETLLGETAGQTSFVTEETLTRVDMRLSAGRSDGKGAPPKPPFFRSYSRRSRAKPWSSMGSPGCWGGAVRCCSCRMKRFPGWRAARRWRMFSRTCGRRHSGAYRRTRKTRCTPNWRRALSTGAR